MLKRLSEAICALTCELFEHRKLMLSQLATKRDLNDAANAILLELRASGISDGDRRLLAASLAKAAGVAKRVKAVALSMASLDAET